MRARVANKVVLPQEHATGPVPRLHDVEQDDLPFVPAAAVKIQGIVNTHELPARDAIMRSIRVTSASAETLAQRDPRRKSLAIWTEEYGIYLSTNSAGVTGPQPDGIHLPAGGSVELNHTQAVFIAGDNAEQSHVSYVMEMWAD